MLIAAALLAADGVLRRSMTVGAALYAVAIVLVIAMVVRAWRLAPMPDDVEEQAHAAFMARRHASPECADTERPAPTPLRLT